MSADWNLTVKNQNQSNHLQILLMFHPHQTKEGGSKEVWWFESRYPKTNLWGEELTDEHIHFAQQLLQQQFPSLKYTQPKTKLLF